MWMRNHKHRMLVIAVAAVIVIGAAIWGFWQAAGSGQADPGEPPPYATNPIIWADVPDPSVIRVGNVYYMSSTTMHMMPGTPIMRSTDLVNWEIIGYPYQRLEENDAYALRGGQNAYGKGAWASSLNYRDGRFYVLFAALDTGKTYLFSTDDPAGRWERTEFNTYMHDPSLLFDDDGKAYIIHGRTDLRISELSPDLTSLNPHGLNQTIIPSGQEGMEGAHAYKINGRYYIATIWWEQGNIRRQYIYRADRIDGPYEGRLALSDTMGYKNNGVAQGGLVDTPDGKWYAMLFQDHDAVGRIPVLVPVRWEDGWPVYGDEEGKVPLTFVKPPGTSSFTTELVRSDDFYQEGIIEEEPEPVAEPDTNVEFTKNYDFADGLANWKARGSEVRILTEDGNRIAHVTKRVHTWAGIEQSFSWRMQSGKEYKATFRIRYTEGPEQKEFVLTAQKTSGGQTSYQNLVRGVANRGEWTVIQGTFVIDDDPSSLDLFLETPWVEQPDAERDMMDFYVDYVSIKENLPPPSANPEAAPNGSKLGLTWQWNHNPDNSRWSLTERRGYLRLRTASVAESIEQARNTLTQRTQGPYSSGWISLDTRHMLEGDVAGLAAFQQEYGLIGVTKQDGRSYLIMAERSGERAREELLAEQVYLKIDMDFSQDVASFYYSYDGTSWTQFGSQLRMRYTLPHFMGYRFAIFNYATKQLGGYVDVDYFRFEPELTGESTPLELTAGIGGGEIIMGSDPSMVYDVPVVVNQLPAYGNIASIRMELHIPQVLEVLEIVPDDGLRAEVRLEATDGGVRATFLSTSSGPVRYDKQGDGIPRLAVIRLRMKQAVEDTQIGEVGIREMIIQYEDHREESYDVSGAHARVSMTIPASAVGKVPPYGNPLVSNKFGADPYALVYQGRVYLYMTADAFEYDANGHIKENTYGTINKITVISSDDLVNWTDHGEIHVAGRDGAAKWATQSWAPAVAHKVIDGKDRFFLYFANNASNIGVLTSDSPLGPWVDPIGKPLIERSTPGVAGVHWLFDPAVLVDDDGSAYIYFGGGVPEGQWEHPMTARVMKLGDDMISVVGEAVTIDAPYMFEDNGIHKFNGVYYYTYCSNFYSGERPPGSPGAGEIVYMTSDSPMGPWAYGGSILKNPGHFFDVGGNNHHAIFEFGGDWYIAYHAQTLSKAMGHFGKGYRSTHLNRVFFDDSGAILDIQADYQGVEQVQALDPYERVEGETFAWQAGVKTRPIAQEDPVQRALADIHGGDWIALSRVNFGEQPAASFTAAISNVQADGFIEIRIDGLDGQRIGTLQVHAADVGSGWTELTAALQPVQGVHDVYLIFFGPPDIPLFELDYWRLNR